MGSNNAVAVAADPQEAALLKAVGLDRVPAEQRTLALHIAERYGLDLMLRHIVMVDGKPYITRDGLLHVAHRSGVFDGIEVTDPQLVDKHWLARATVYRKDMSRGFSYQGRYPAAGKNQTFAPEMAVKVAEVMSLRRAFDVSAPVVEERWDLDEQPAAPVSTARPVALADKVAARRASIEARTTDASEAPAPEPAAAPDTGGTSAAVHAPEEPTPPSSGEPSEPRVDPASVQGAAATSAPSSSPAPTCGSPSPYDDGGTCNRPVGHAERIYCTDGRATWPRPKDWK